MIRGEIVLALLRAVSPPLAARAFNVCLKTRQSTATLEAKAVKALASVRFYRGRNHSALCSLVRRYG
jgi:hypothetical protein